MGMVSDQHPPLPLGDPKTPHLRKWRLEPPSESSWKGSRG